MPVGTEDQREVCAPFRIPRVGKEDRFLFGCVKVKARDLQQLGKADVAFPKPPSHCTSIHPCERRRSRYADRWHDGHCRTARAQDGRAPTPSAGIVHYVTTRNP